MNRLVHDVKEWQEHYDPIERAAFITLELLEVVHEQIPDLESIDKLAEAADDLERVLRQWWRYYVTVEDFTTFQTVDAVVKSIEQALYSAVSRIEELASSQ